MPSAAWRNADAAARERKRRELRSVESGGGYSLISSSPEWDGFFGSLRDQEELAQAAGMGYRVNLGGIGRDGSEGMDPSGRPNSGFLAQTLASEDISRRIQAANAERDEFNRQRQQQVLNDLNTDYINHVMASDMAPPVAPHTITKDTTGTTPKYTIRETPQAPREAIMNALPRGAVQLRAQYEKQFADEDAAREKAALEERKVAVLENKPKDERLVQVMGPQGTPIWVRESDAEGKPAAQAARAVTEAERKALAFYNRAQDAVNTLTSGAAGKSLEDSMAQQSYPRQVQLAYEGIGSNLFKSADQQIYRQAQRAFTEARLRKESGAAVPPHEYESDARTYFVQPGDDPKTVEQKRKARQTVLDGLAYSSGKAYDEFYGESRPNPNVKGGGGKAADPLGIR